MSHPKIDAKAVIVAVFAAGTLVACGCTAPTSRTDAKLINFIKAPEWMKKAPWSKGDTAPTPYPGPVKMAVTWTSDVLVQSGKTPTRGFGGRLFFFDEKSKAVPVEGTLTIHGFEGQANGKEGSIRPFKFTPEQFTKHFSQSDFGASYSVWIPWDAVGGDQKRVSLVATFQTTGGKLVQGAPTTVILPGKMETDESLDSSTVFSPQYQNHLNAIAQHPTRPSGLVTTTIHRHKTSADGSQTVPGSTIQDRLNAIAASQRLASADGKTPFIDVPLSPAGLAVPPSVVMPTSGVMPAPGTNPVQNARHATTAPRRIKSPATTSNR
jgi:hypothetical protein